MRASLTAKPWAHAPYLSQFDSGARTIIFFQQDFVLIYFQQIAFVTELVDVLALEAIF